MSRDTTIKCDACGKPHDCMGLLRLSCLARTAGPMGFEEFEISNIDVCDLACLESYIEKRRDDFMTIDCDKARSHIPMFGPVPYAERQRLRESSHSPTTDVE